MTLIEMLTLRRPYSGYNPAQVYARVREGVRPGRARGDWGWGVEGGYIGLSGGAKDKANCAAAI
jgi:hypothetical protein